MIKTTAFIGLGLCVLLLSGCGDPKIDGVSDYEWENSLIRVTRELPNERKDVFKAALDVVINRHRRLLNLPQTSNGREAVIRKSADDVIKMATDISISEYNKVVAQNSLIGINQPVLTRRQVLDNVRISKVFKIDKIEDEYMAEIELENKNNTDVDMALIKLFAIDETGTTSGWIGYIRFGRNNLQGVIKANRHRRVTIPIMHEAEENFPGQDETEAAYNWNCGWRFSSSSNKPKTDGLTLKIRVLALRMNNETYNWNDPEPSTGSAPTLPSDIDQFLTLIKYKR